MKRTALCLVLLLSACKREPAPPAPAPPAAAQATAPEAAPPAAAGEEQVKPVYSAFAGDAAPLAVKLCGALHDLPEARRDACCSWQKGTVLTDECVKTVSGALRSGSLALDAAAVDACVAAEEKLLSGCAWVGPGRSPLAKECAGLFHGKRATGEVCRSSLDCAEGQLCLGSGPTDEGRCGAPRQAGQACLSSVDPLAGFARQDVQTHHPECAGFCGHRICEATVPLKAACVVNGACGKGNHCDGKICAPGPSAKEGEGCVADACADGLRCVLARCVAPKADGAACVTDAECAAGCSPKTHTCGMRCDAR